MAVEQLIEKINKATAASQVFEHIDKWSEEWRNYSYILHPDRCSLPGAEDAIRQLNMFKTSLEKGLKIKDDVGEVTYKFKQVRFTGDKNMLLRSFENWKQLMSFTDPSSINFKKYIPETAEFDGDDLIFNLWQRAVPLISLGTLSQEHVNWVTNRMFEFIAWLHEKGFSHNGITPESIFVSPHDHGMVCCSFYHMTKLGDRLKTGTGRYYHFYPNQSVVHKVALSETDISMVKSNAIFLLGDKSGIGTSLRKTHNLKMLDFYQKPESNTYDSMDTHHKLVKSEFKKEFHILNA